MSRCNADVRTNLKPAVWGEGPAAEPSPGAVAPATSHGLRPLCGGPGCVTSRSSEFRHSETHRARLPWGRRGGGGGLGRPLGSAGVGGGGAEEVLGEFPWLHEPGSSYLRLSLWSSSGHQTRSEAETCTDSQAAPRLPPTAPGLHFPGTAPAGEPRRASQTPVEAPRQGTVGGWGWRAGPRRVAEIRTCWGRRAGPSARELAQQRGTEGGRSAQTPRTHHFPPALNVLRGSGTRPFPLSLALQPPVGFPVYCTPEAGLDPALLELVPKRTVSFHGQPQAPGPGCWRGGVCTTWPPLPLLEVPLRLQLPGPA